jgi:hypothetical protein
MIKVYSMPKKSMQEAGEAMLQRVLTGEPMRCKKCGATVNRGKKSAIGVLWSPTLGATAYVLCGDCRARIRTI